MEGRNFRKISSLSNLSERMQRTLSPSKKRKSILHKSSSEGEYLFQNILEDDEKCKIFYEYLIKIHADENYEAWLLIQEYKGGGGGRKEIAQKIIQMFPRLNIDEIYKKEIGEKIKVDHSQSPYQDKLFSNIEQMLFHLMQGCYMFGKISKDLS